MNTKFLETPTKCRGRSRTAGTSKVELFVIIVNGLELFVIIVKGWKPSTIITKSSTLNVPAVLDPPLHSVEVSRNLLFKSVSPPTSK